MTTEVPADAQPHRLGGALGERSAKPARPRSYAARPSGRPVLVCAGDSITHGVISANWVRQVARAVAPAVDTVNAGVSGNLAWNLLSRLDEVVACRPALVTVLIGTNDALSQISRNWSDGYMKRQHLPRRPDIGWYGDNLERIVGLLKSETSARIALMSLPPLGNTADGRWEDVIAPYNTVIHDVAARAELPFLPVHERIAGLIRESQPSPWDGTQKLMGAAIWRRFLLRRSWNAIARRQGFSVTTDGVHLNEPAAAQIAALVEQFVLGDIHHADASAAA